MKKILFYFLASTLAIFTACEKDEELKKAPVVTAPAVQSVAAGSSVDITFNYTSEAGFKSAALSAANKGTATVKTNGIAGSNSGTIVVTFTAGNSIGAGSVLLTVTDNSNQNSTATGVFDVTGGISITPPSAQTVAINDEIEITFNFNTVTGFKSAVATGTNGTASITTNGVVGATTGTVTVKFVAGTSTGAGSVVLTVTDNINETGNATATIEVKPGISVNTNISENTTWKTGKVYILESRVAVLSGATLTIEPGVVVKGAAGTGANATALLIARGAKLMAEGTETQPIIFTSTADEILPGEIASPNLSSDLDGLWGGLLILGNAKISVSGNVESKQIEGIPVSDANGLYGGTDDADNSGVVKYVSIRHGGANIGEGNEINGLTLGGVGSGTVIENVEIIANQDDGIEWFGGTVIVKNAIVWNAGDDAIDTDQSWGGTLDNFIVINPFDKCFELDGPEGAYAAKHIIKNGSIKAVNAVGLVDIDNANDSKDSYLDLMNLYFYSVKTPQTFDGLPKFASYPFSFSDFQITLPDGKAITDFFKGGSDVYATAVASGQNTVGADKTKFNATWSWATLATAY